jgi:hypothetical protein
MPFHCHLCVASETATQVLESTKRRRATRRTAAAAERMKHKRDDASPSYALAHLLMNNSGTVIPCRRRLRPRVLRCAHTRFTLVVMHFRHVINPLAQLPDLNVAMHSPPHFPPSSTPPDAMSPSAVVHTAAPPRQRVALLTGAPAPRARAHARRQSASSCRQIRASPRLAAPALRPRAPRRARR